uniref:U-actitoxin-Ate1 n=1 Tax=Actinia tenebrosa TaxID=6105 RepID=ACR1_ACTTE|nr:RecName: Full=U-actitoxin-Ate1; Short=U-AITX-Ate1; Flags: Precursor [Actinia tenebrosa]
MSLILIFFAFTVLKSSKWICANRSVCPI